MAKLDLSKFKKIRSDKHSTLMRHQDGHFLRVAHRALSPDMVKDLHEMQAHEKVGKKADKHEAALAAPQMSEGGQASKMMPQPANIKPGEKPGSSYAKVQENRSKIMHAKGGEVQHFDQGGPVYTYDKYGNISGKTDTRPPEQKVGESITNDLSGKKPPAQYFAKGGIAKQEAYVEPEAPAQAPIAIAQPPMTPSPADQQQIEAAKALGGEPATLSLSATPSGQQLNAAPGQASADRPGVIKTVSNAEAADTQNQVNQLSQSVPFNLMQQLQDAAGSNLPATPDTTPPPQAAQPMAAAMPPQAQPQPQNDNNPWHMKEMAAQTRQGIQEQEKGLVGQGQSEIQGAQQQASIQHAKNKVMLDLANQAIAANQKYNKDVDEQVKWLKENPVRANDFMQSKDTGGKIMTAIGLMLGGLGSGMTGGPNMALEFLNKQIDRNIEGQKANIGQHKTLLDTFYNKYHNMQAATEMTRATMQDYYAGVAQEKAMQIQDPVLKAKTLQALGQFHEAKAGAVQSVAMKESLLSGMKQGVVSPAHVINTLVPPEQRNEANKELNEMQMMASAKANVLSGFDQVDKLQTVGSRMLDPLQSKAKINSILGPLVAGLSKATAGRFTEQDAGMLTPLFPDVTDNAETRAFKRQRLQQLIEEKMHSSVLEHYGIVPKELGTYGSQGQSKFKEMPPVIR